MLPGAPLQSMVGYDAPRPALETFLSVMEEQLNSQPYHGLDVATVSDKLGDLNWKKR
jgi:hypothetical protein